MTRTVIQSDDIASGAVDSGLSSVQTFTSSGTWTRPSGITKVVVEVQGAGGSGSDGQAGNNKNNNGGSGGYVKKLLDVSSISSATITIGQMEEHTSELQSHSDLVCRLLLEKKK